MEDFEPHPYNLHEYKLHILKENYDRSNNPLFVWEALKYCIDHEWPSPIWVCSYFEKVAESFLELPNSSVNLDKRADFEITEILGMKKIDSRNVFDRYRIHKRDMSIFERVIDLAYEYTEEDVYQTQSLSYAFEIIAKELNLEPETVSKIYYRWAPELGFT